MSLYTVVIRKQHFQTFYRCKINKNCESTINNNNNVNNYNNRIKNYKNNIDNRRNNDSDNNLLTVLILIIRTVMLTSIH